MLDKLTKEYDRIAERVKAGKLPLVARIPAIKRAVDEYELARAEFYEKKRDSGVKIPLEYRHDGRLLEQFADLILYEELTWSHPDKMSIIDYPIMSDSQAELREDKYAPHPDLQYGDRRYMGRRKTHFTDDYGAPQVRNSRVVDKHDPTIEVVGDYIDLYDALENAELTDRQRQAIDLVYFGSMSQEDARRIMGVSKATMSEHISVALRKLRDYMTKD